jgi:hypothetical protein
MGSFASPATFSISGGHFNRGARWH